MSNIQAHTTEDLVEELQRRSVAAYIALWSYDIKSGECFSIEETKGDPRLIRGVIEDAYDSGLKCLMDELDDDDDTDDEGDILK